MLRGIVLQAGSRKEQGTSTLEKGTDNHTQNKAKKEKTKKSKNSTKTPPFIVERPGEVADAPLAIACSGALRLLENSEGEAATTNERVDGRPKRVREWVCHRRKQARTLDSSGGNSTVSICCGFLSSSVRFFPPFQQSVVDDDRKNVCA